MGSIAVFLPLLILIGIIIFLIIRTKKTDKIVIDENGNEVKSGLGGWLILVGFGVVLSPLMVLSQLSTFVTLFKDGSYALLSTPGGAGYTPFFSSLLWIEIILNALIFFASFYLIFLFFSKKKLFPKFYIWLLVGSLVFVVLDAWLAMLVFNFESLDPTVVKDIVRPLVATIIWVPYMLKSKRVKATFVE